MAKITIQDLLEAGCHFGHQTKRWNPKMKHYVYGVKNGISIIDLTKTMFQINDACNFLQHVVSRGGDLLFVGTKRQAQEVIRESAEATGMFYVSERWLGGTLTNNVTIRKSIAKMTEIDKLLSDDEAGKMKKKELSQLTRRTEKLHRDLDGIFDMKKLPAAMIVVDICNDDIAIREARKLNIPVVAIVDTNADPSLVDYPIAANDDAVKSIKLIMDIIIDSIKVAAEINKKRLEEDRIAKEAERQARKEKEGEQGAENSSKAPRRRAAHNDDGRAKRRPARKTGDHQDVATDKVAPAEKAAPAETPVSDKKEESTKEKVEAAKSE
ncbi:MAG: 30S ribosomal protein S2 [Victivallaceae bacterium]|nr:30S ribosomal protein S2 [Victivallaceae bacterium]MDD4318698.1 30S ribosomal protein S2 [Victivallaceae bacterium]NLK83160.1 30S ribosomal protein S2 [Lentisphaerota bacterium]